MKKKKKKKKYRSLKPEITRLTIAYTFLLSAVVIFMASLRTFPFSVLNETMNCSIFVAPFAYFLVDVILKEIGDRPAKIAVIVSTVMFYVTTVLIDMIIVQEFNITNYIGESIAYFVSQVLNYYIYYYMLSNYKTPLYLVILDLIFCLLIKNIIDMLFYSNMIITNSFWMSYLIIIALQSILVLALSIILGFIEQGLDV